MANMWGLKIDPQEIQARQGWGIETPLVKRICQGLPGKVWIFKTKRHNNSKLSTHCIILRKYHFWGYCIWLRTCIWWKFNFKTVFILLNSFKICQKLSWPHNDFNWNTIHFVLPLLLFYLITGTPIFILSLLQKDNF